MDIIKEVFQYLKENNTLVSIFTAMISFVVLFLATYISDLIKLLIENKLGLKKPQKIESYSDKLATLTASLSKASAEVDNVISELSSVALDREKTVKELEVQLKRLEEDEHIIQKRIQDLQSIPVPVLEHFSAIISQGEQRSAKRDYVLFGSGVIITTIIAIIMKYIGF